MAGFVVGGLVCLRWRPRRGPVRRHRAALAHRGVPARDGALRPPAGRSCSAPFLHGLGLEIFSVNWDLSIQQNIAEDKLARVYSFDLVGSFVARPLGLALTGPVAAAVGFDRWLVVVGCVMGGSSLLALLSRTYEDWFRT